MNRVRAAVPPQYLYALAFGALLIAAAAHADDGNSNAQGNAQGSAHVSATTGAATPEPRVVLSGLMPSAAGQTTYLRFTNAGHDSGTATVTLVAAADGTVLGTWTSPTLASRASLQVDLAAIAVQATPALTAAQATAGVDVRIESTFGGDVQAVVWNAAASSLTPFGTCGLLLPESRHVLGYVEAAGTANVTSAVRLTNAGDNKTRSAELTLYNAADGSTLGTWTSPDIAPGASLTMTTATLSAAVTPAVPSATTALTVAAHPDESLVLSHVVMSGTNHVAADLTAACILTPHRTPNGNGKSQEANGN